LQVDAVVHERHDKKYVDNCDLEFFFTKLETDVNKAQYVVSEQ